MVGLAVASTILCGEPPQGSLTIDRIADIKYPTDQMWSPDSKTIAFLWDAAGKQDTLHGQAWRKAGRAH